MPITVCETTSHTGTILSIGPVLTACLKSKAESSTPEQSQLLFLGSTFWSTSEIHPSIESLYYFIELINPSTSSLQQLLFAAWNFPSNRRIESNRVRFSREKEPVSKTRLDNSRYLPYLTLPNLCC